MMLVSQRVKRRRKNKNKRMKKRRKNMMMKSITRRMTVKKMKRKKNSFEKINKETQLLATDIQNSVRVSKCATS